MVLSIVYSPVDVVASPAVDIVAVHGLGGDAIHTWTHPKSKAIWLKDFLPAQIPNARIMTFGYNAAMALGQSTAEVIDHARSLLASLVDKREEPEEIQRPLIFIAHSLGGIVVKQALLQARLESRYHCIKDATRGLIFLGTPHRGSEKATYGKVLANVAQFVTSRPPARLLKALETNSATLQRLTADFRHQLPDYQVYSFYEQRPMKGFSNLIVEKYSALLDVNHEEQIPVDSDHSAMCKFETESDDTFEKVYKRVRRMMKTEPPPKAVDPADSQSTLVPHPPVDDPYHALPPSVGDSGSSPSPNSNSSDPTASNSLTVADLALQIPTFLSDFAKVMKCIQDVQKEYIVPPTLMASVAAQCHGIQTAMARLQRLDVQGAVAFKNEHQRIVHVLQTIVIGCKGALSLIEEYILDFRATAGKQIANQEKIDAKLEAVWKGEDIEELLSQLDGYQTGLTNLLVVSQSTSIHEIHSLLTDQIFALDDLIERSRISWNKKPSTMTPSGSLRFSILTHSDNFSTTAIHTDRECDETPESLMPLDHEIANSRAYRRVMFRNLRQRSRGIGIDAARTMQKKTAASSPLPTIASTSQESLVHSSDGTISRYSPLGGESSNYSNSNSNSNIHSIQVQVQQPDGPVNRLDTEGIASRTSTPTPTNMSLGLTSGLMIQRPQNRPRNFSRLDWVPRQPEQHPDTVSSLPAAESDLAFPVSDDKAVSGPETSSSSSAARQLYKLILLGGGAVGKSPLVLQFLHPGMIFASGDNWDPTIEDSYRAECSVDGKRVSLDIVDHSGQMEYSGLWEEHIRTCDSIMLVYSITSRSSYEEVLYFIEQIPRLHQTLNRNDERLPLILVGNKCDLGGHREVSTAEGQSLADNIMCPFFETSAMSNINVQEAFHEAVREIQRSRESFIDWMIGSFARATGRLHLNLRGV
ncbi:hypothetical protein A1O3_02684 [Capronia epimyces CBS 606.96]|uniref:DUF676 domain-containing protein n=1 Tax=Capronia epimyces CBS 606.96 TaxID=1182542 RepID=W9Y9T6_9EURO|nr:uncharacterized protein A1O3_02684 [Capronia epimyces CBS 606.96]EXJ89617.1 hypothetical protein A1O3_02684 [Capronia epimyces CBS 606.96]